MGSTEVIYKTRVVFTINDLTKALSDNYLCYNVDSDESEDNSDSEEEDDDKKQITSDGFAIGSERWQVMVELKDSDNKQYLGVYLKLRTTGAEDIDAEYDVYVRDIDGQLVSGGSIERTAFEDHSYWGPKEFVKRSLLLDQMDKYLPNDSLTLVFDITVFKPTIGPKRRRHFGNSFLNKELNAFTFIVCGKEFPASKAIVSDRSEVFEKMFTTNMSEKTTNEVIIDDIDPNVFEEFLRFLYFGETDKLEVMAEELLYVSNKYMVSDLKTICENLYYLRINPKNAFKVLEVLNKYGTKELVSKSIEYIKTHLNQCLETKWPTLVSSDNSLIDQLIVGLKSESIGNKTQTISYTYIPGL